MKPIVKKLLIGAAVAGLVGLIVKGMNSTKKDKFGGVMTLNDNPKGQSNTVYNGVLIDGWIRPGTLTLIDGLWNGLGGDERGTPYIFDGAKWVVK